MVKIEFRQKNRDGTEALVYCNEGNKLESVVFVGKAPRVYKVYVVPKDKLREVLQMLYEGKINFVKYEEINDAKRK